MIPIKSIIIFYNYQVALQGTNIHGNNFEKTTNSINDNDKKFRLKCTTETEVRNIISKIQTNATGHDDINIDMIKTTLDVTLPLIVTIINKSIMTNTFPACWKTALIKPIPKKGVVEEMKDLRPISILPTLSKVLERVVLKQVEEYLQKENIIPKYQSGVCRNHSTESTLLHVTGNITEASDKGLSSVMVLLDYSRAFDCLHPAKLLDKLSKYGFSDDTCSWFQTFLTNREQIVVTEDASGNKKHSESGKLVRGVPQGSILSPMLFTIYTADLPSVLQTCQYHLYADDTQIYHSFDSKDTKDAFQKINLDLQRIY